MAVRIIKIGRYGIEVSNEDKIIFSEGSIAKGQLIEYYQKIAPVMLRHTKDRPISMQRFPNGVAHEGFYQKDAGDYFPSWIVTKSIKKQNGTVNYVLCNNAATFVYLANQACITIHTWLSRVDKLKYPDRMIFDLDPSKKDFSAVCVTAKKLKIILESCGLKPFVMTTGSKGVHVVVPIKRMQTFTKVRAYAKKVAQELVAQDPQNLTLEVRKNKRQGRIFIDTFRNAFGQTGVAPYSVRPLPGAPVATPLAWGELDDKNLRAQSYTIKNIFKRLAQKGDPWRDINKYARGLPKMKVAK